MEARFYYEPPADVYLIGLGAAEEVLAKVTRGYSQVYEEDISEAEIEQFLEDLSKTKLQTPNAFVNTVWLLRNVTRNFEQQLTRYRVGTAFVCESLRFSDKRQAEFYCKAKSLEGKRAYEESIQVALDKYEEMLLAGEATQDARDVLPGSLCTHLFLSINLQALTHVYSQRQCCQAQAEEWNDVLAQMMDLLAENSQALADFLKAPWEDPNCVSCGFNASFDRPCLHQAKFDRNLKDRFNDLVKRNTGG